MTSREITLHDTELKILSMFLTVDGECNSYGPGVWSVFIRTAGCDVHCNWCDTKYSWSWKQGEVLSVDTIVARADTLAKHLPFKKITITGGEPLQQWYNGLRTLIDTLLFAGWRISIETSGCVRIPEELKNAPNVCLVVDYKLPSSGVVMQPVPDNYDASLGQAHYVKFVIAGIKDFFGAVAMAKEMRDDGCEAQIYFSPCFGKTEARELFTWMKNNAICQQAGVRFNMQIHKFIFPGDWRDEEQDAQA